jgi:hypothetical protein
LKDQTIQIERANQAKAFIGHYSGRNARKYFLSLEAGHLEGFSLFRIANKANISYSDSNKGCEYSLFGIGK